MTTARMTKAQREAHEVECYFATANAIDQMRRMLDLLPEDMTPRQWDTVREAAESALEDIRRVERKTRSGR